MLVVPLDSAFGGHPYVAKASLWTKLLGNNSAWALDLFRAADGAYLDAGAAQRMLSFIHAASAASAAEALDATLPANRFGAMPGSAIVSESGGASVGDAPLVTVLPGPASGAGNDGHRLAGILLDLPWQLAFGLAPISLDSGSLADVETRGWLEALLSERALSSPFSLEIDADPPSGDMFGLTAALGPARGAIVLSGDFSAGFTLTSLPFEVSWLAVSAGNDFNLVVEDTFVGAGGVLVIDAGQLGVGDHILFDGSAETEGRFHFSGSAGDDFFFGGAGADRVEGGAGADSLSGGAGGDLFIYRSAAHSSGAGYDTIADFNPAADRIDLPGAVNGFRAAVAGGSLSTATFDSDLATAIGNLGASQAVWFAPNAGDLAGQIFLIADGNGKAGYQAGEDYVFAIAGASLADLAGHTDFFV